MTVTTGARGINAASWCSGTSARRDSGSSSFAALATWPISVTTIIAVSWSSTWLIVTMLPSFISTLITSAALTDILWARSPTLMVSGTMSSRTTGSAGALNCCTFSAAGATAVLCLAPLGVCQPEAPCTSPRVLIVRRLTPSSFQTLISFAFFAPFFSAPGATFGLCSVVSEPGAEAGACVFISLGLPSASLRSRSCFSAKSAACLAANSSCRRCSSSRSSASRESTAAPEEPGASAGAPGSASRLTKMRFFLTSTWMVRAFPLASDFLMISEVCLRVSVILFLGSDEPCDLRRYSRSRVLSCSERTSSATCLCTPAARSCSSSCDGGTFSSPANWATLVWAMGRSVLLLGKPMFTRLHDQALGTLRVDSRHLDEVVGGEIGQVVASLHPGPGKLRRQVLVHSLETEQRRIEVFRLFLARDGLYQERVA